MKSVDRFDANDHLKFTSLPFEGSFIFILVIEIFK